MLSQSSHSSKQSPTSQWRRLLVRSRSLEGVGSDDDHNQDESNKTSHRSTRRRQRLSLSSRQQKQETNNNNGGWAGWLLLTPPSRLVGNPLQRSSNAPATKRHLLSSLRPSNLTLFLLHLDQVMPQVCKILSTNSLKDCQEAARILDSSFSQQECDQLSPASSTSNSSLSPNFFRSSPKQHQQQQALHGEWETHVSPLLLLTGAQALYGQLECSSHLVELYKTIARDLSIVKERLCDPWLTSSTIGEESTAVHPPKSNAHQAAALSMARIFDGLQVYIDLKCQTVDMQTTLVAPTRQECFLDKTRSLLETCRGIMSSLPSSTNEHGSAMDCMFASLRQEIKAWMALLQCVINLEQCRFTDTILSIRTFQRSIGSSDKTVLQQWFRHVLQRLLSIMPVYFDRIYAFASPLYGFDTFPTNEENDNQVLDFLRKHESKGGPSMAVCVVVNAVATDNENFSRGFVMERPNNSTSRDVEQSSTQREQLTPAERERKEWQAVYMRSTLHYNTPTTSPLTRSPSHGGSRSSIMRRTKHTQGSSSSSSFRKNASEDQGDFSMSLANIMRPVSQDSTAPAHSSQMSVMEYPPTTDPVSWPHSEWSQLVELVNQDLSPCSDDDGFTSVQAVTYRQPDPTPAPPKEKKTPLGLPPPVPPPPKQRTDSSFHLVRLGEFTTMVVIARCEDDGKWHLRRTRGHSDEEIRVFLNEMALKLKVSILFENIDKTTLRLKTNERDDDLVRAWGKASNAQDFLGELKRSFHLRPQSPYMENLSRSRGMTTPGGSRRKKRAVSYGESALAFFVGPDITLKQREG